MKKIMSSRTPEKLMNNSEIYTKYYSLVTRFLDSLGDGFARQHTSIKQPFPQQCSNNVLKSLTPSVDTQDCGTHLKELDDTIKICQKCTLHTTRKNVVTGQGSHNPIVLVIGEGPGYYEDLQGLPFVGKSGQYLDKWLSSIGLERNKNCYITNLVKCRPPDNRDPSPDEIASCLPYLKDQIELLNPYVILACGRIAGQILTQKQSALTSLRQSVHYYKDFPLFVTYHPSAVLRNQELRRLVWNDLKFLRSYILKMGIQI